MWPRPMSRLDENGCLANARITCRHRNEIIEVDRDTDRLH